MLLQRSSPAPLLGGSEWPCAKCGTPTAGIALGGLCASCERALRRKAARIARWVAIGTTVPLAVYVTRALPPDPTSRWVGVIAVLIWYVLTGLVARRVALEWLK